MITATWHSGNNQNVGLSVPVVSRWLWPENRAFLEVASMVVTWWTMAFFAQWISLYGKSTVHAMILLLHEWRWAWLHALWVLRWLFNPIGALNSREQCGHGCSCCPGDGGLWALSLRSRRFWMAFWIRSFSYSVTPERTLLRQAGRSDASSSQALWSMPQHFRETFSVSLKRFFSPPLERFPAQSSP